MTTRPSIARHANDQPAQSPPDNSHNLTKVGTAVIGCVLLICCALAITHLGGWADDW